MNRRSQRSHRGRISPGFSGWTPSAVAPLAWFYIGPNGEYISTATDTTWTDRVGGFVASQSVAGEKPTYSATGWNSARPALTFDGGDSLLCTTAGLAAFLDGADIPYTVFVTMAPNTPTVPTGVLAWENATHTRGMGHTLDNATTVFRTRYRRRDDSGITSNIGTGNVPAAANTFAWVFSGTAITTYFGSTLDLNGAANDKADIHPTEFRIGRYFDAGEFMHGPMVDIVIVNGLIGGSVAKTVATYLTNYRPWSVAEFGGFTL